MKWEKKSVISLVSEIITGEWGEDHGDINIIRTTNFTNNGTLNLKEVVKRNISVDKIQSKKLIYGDIIIEKSGGSKDQPVGRVVYFNIREGLYLCNNFTSIIRAKNEFNNKYLFWFLFYNHATKNTLQFQNKTTGILNLKLDNYLNNLQIPLPPLPIQKRIAEILDIADALRKKDELLLRKYDDLAQSIFIDMFGDPVKNEKRWDVKSLGDVCDIQGGYAFKSSDMINTGIKLVKISNVHFDKLSWDEVQYLPEHFLDDHSDYKLLENDICIALTRPIIKSLNSVKVVKVRNDDLPCLLNQRVARFICHDIITNQYLLNFLYTNYFKNKVEKISSTSLQPNISTNQISEIKILLPPLKVQNKYSEVIKKIESSTSIQKNSNLQSQNLFQSLLQKAFRGELVS